MRDRGFEQVAEIVELVAVVALEHPPLGTGPAMRILRIDRARRVDVAVGLLRGGDLRDQSVDVGIELRIGRDAERIRRAFDHLVEIGFVERIAGRTRVDVRVAAQHRGGALEQVDAAGQLALLERRRNARGAVDLDARRPELVVEMHGGERHRLDRIVGLGGARGCANRLKLIGAPSHATCTTVATPRRRPPPARSAIIVSLLTSCMRRMIAFGPMPLASHPHNCHMPPD